MSVNNWIDVTPGVPGGVVTEALCDLKLGRFLCVLDLSQWVHNAVPPVAAVSLSPLLVKSYLVG